MQKGQHFAVLKLLQGAVFATLFLVLVWGALSWMKSQSPGTDVATVATDVLKSAYSARGEDSTSFARSAWLKGQFFTADGLAMRAALPESAVVKIVCEQGYCVPPTPCSGSDSITLEKGDKVSVCASCEIDVGVETCRVYIGETVCWDWSSCP